MKAILATSVLLFASLIGLGQERYLRPLDQASRDKSLVAFRARLIAAVRKQDARFVYSVVDPKIRISFGGDDGINGFKETWKLETSGSTFWQEFLACIENGGLFFRPADRSTDIFIAPYTFEGFPEELDSLEHGAIVGMNVNLRRTPDNAGEVVARLNYNLVKVDYENSVKSANETEELLWVKVTTFGGLTGYVSADYFRSPADYRAGFEKKRGQWKLIFFLSGD